MPTTMIHTKNYEEENKNGKNECRIPEKNKQEYGDSTRGSPVKGHRTIGVNLLKRGTYTRSTAQGRNFSDGRIKSVYPEPGRIPRRSATSR
jgi:hypothetical protein